MTENQKWDKRFLQLARDRDYRDQDKGILHGAITTERICKGHAGEIWRRWREKVHDEIEKIRG
jgi:hypothetical protein